MSKCSIEGCEDNAVVYILTDITDLCLKHFIIKVNDSEILTCIGRDSDND